MEQRLVKTSKFLSLVLRHNPGKIGLQLDQAGWTLVEELLSKCRAHGVKLTAEELREVVARNDKQRFSYSEDGLMIRANQGHSIEVDLEYEPALPPAVLYHGTAEKFLPSIKEQGLIKGRRHHVHLSADLETAHRVGQRHGQPVVLRVRAGEMQEAGFLFYLSANGVWLTEQVPVPYLLF
ncbi:MAG TPA: RNA 2'-phosphotransferase [Blastocatellia bacterium]|nr:RNA 2'-phosphotransferase [Blastocatellia bacterium]